MATTGGERGRPERANASRPPDAQRAEAVPPLAAATAAATGDGYDALVAAAVDAGRARRSSEAPATLLDRAIVLDSRRPEAWTERGGVRFLEGRYADAAADLRRALAIREDEYARDLLAAALQLDGRELEALAAWNPLGKPALKSVDISGLAHTRDEVARREIGLEAGETVDSTQPCAPHAAGSRRPGAFDRVTLRTASGGDGTSTLEVALAERHGLGRPLDLAVTTGINLAWQRLRLRYSNVAGTGLALGVSLRWQENRPETALQLQVPRPLGLPGVPCGSRASAASRRTSSATVSTCGAAASTLRCGTSSTAGTVVSLGVRAARPRRSHGPTRARRPGGSSASRPASRRGSSSRGASARRRPCACFGAAPALGSDAAASGRSTRELRYEGVLSRPEGRSVERSVLAARVRAGWGSDGLPVDEMYAPGISPESDLPLRAHPLDARRRDRRERRWDGRSLLGNVEWRQRLLHRPAFDIGVTAFADAARVNRAIDADRARRLRRHGGRPARLRSSRVRRSASTTPGAFSTDARPCSSVSDQAF